MDTMTSHADALGIASVLLLLLLLVVIAHAIARPHLRARHRFGYGSLGEYLRAVPVSDEEKRDAVDLSLKGLVLCLLGFVFAPLILIGLAPLFYGARKVAYASLGLGLLDDGPAREG